MILFFKSILSDNLKNVIYGSVSDEYNTYVTYV